MEVAAMKRIPARWLALASIALALLWICSCGKDDCPTCPKPSCPSPTKSLLGKWVVFESTVNGSPDQVYMGMQWDFHNSDTLIVATNPNPFVWSANDSIIFIMSTPNPSSEFYAFSYKFEADTLNMRDKTGMPFSVYWRFHRTP
jgi:hypothetical protein